MAGKTVEHGPVTNQEVFAQFKAAELNHGKGKTVVRRAAEKVVTPVFDTGAKIGKKLAPISIGISAGALGAGVIFENPVLVKVGAVGLATDAAGLVGIKIYESRRRKSGHEMKMDSGASMQQESGFTHEAKQTAGAIISQLNPRSTQRLAA